MDDDEIRGRVGWYAAEVARCLSGKWRVEQEHPHEAVLRGEYLQRIRLSVRKRRLVFRGQLHHIWERAPALDAITVNPDRMPYAIARDIERRLIPSYRAAMTVARQGREREEAKAEVLVNNRRLADAVLPGIYSDPTRSGSGWENFHVSLARPKFASVSGKVNDSGTADLKLSSVDMDLFLKALELVAQWNRERWQAEANHVAWANRADQ